MVRALLLRGWIIRPGLETSDPNAAVQRYAEALSEKGLSFQNKRALVFGYGGRFDIGVDLLRVGASHVVLCDKYAPPDEEHNRRLFARDEKYFTMTGDRLRPRQEWMTLLPADIRDEAVRKTLESNDVIVSNSVYEHLDDVEGITGALASLTNPDGVHVHFVDLRDHFFKYPFEMLRYSDRTWYNWLNPSSHHNRYRLWNYRKAFETFFGRVEIKILARDEEAFRRIQPFVLPEFLGEHAEENAVTLIRVVASQPKAG
jgi:hypothetical protein